MSYNKENINKLFNEFLQSGIHQTLSSQFTKTNIDCNVIKLDDTYIYELAIPGVVKKDIAIKLEENHLIVGVHKEEEAIEGVKSLKKEYHYAQSTRRIPIPESADTNSIRAAYKNGVLSIHLNVMKPIEGKKGNIEIK